jgi:adenylate cyclase
MSETRKIAAILVSDVVGYSRLAGADEDRALARLRAVRSDLIDPIIAVHHGRVVKRTGDGAIVEFRSVVDAVRCAIEVQHGMIERNAGVPAERRIVFRIGIHLGDIVEESDGDLMGDGVNIAARLQGIAKPGTICLSEQAYWQVKGRLDLKVSDLGSTQLKNIAEPIHVYELEVAQPAEAKPAPPGIATVKPVSGPPTPRASRWSLRWPALAVIAALLLLAAVGGWSMFSGRLTKPAQAAHLSIVVLPFANLSGDLAQDYFADGVTENLTTELSRIRDSFVIARNTAFTYKGKSVDAKDVGKELGVRYVLEGSVQRDQNRVRVNAQLIDAASGAHLWADRFEEDMADLFKLQDQVVARLASTLGYELVKAEAEKGARAKKPDAIDLTMRGLALLWRQPPTKVNNDAARAFFEEALQIDPDDADALAGEAFTYRAENVYGWTNPETNYEARIFGFADQAIALAPDNMLAYWAKASYLVISRRWNEGLGVAEAGLAINPNFAPLYSSKGVAENSLGRTEAARSDLQTAMRLSPRDPSLGFWHVQLGDVELNSGHLDAAIDEYHMAIDDGFRTFIPYGNIAAVYALQGKMEEAKPFLAEALRLVPHLTVKWFIAHAPNYPILFEGYRKAGVPEE